MENPESPEIDEAIINCLKDRPLREAQIIKSVQRAPATIREHLHELELKKTVVMVALRSRAKSGRSFVAGYCLLELLAAARAGKYQEVWLCNETAKELQNLEIEAALTKKVHSDTVGTEVSEIASIVGRMPEQILPYIYSVCPKFGFILKTVNTGHNLIFKMPSPKERRVYGEEILPRGNQISKKRISRLGET
jgi:hypothetical protein